MRSMTTKRRVGAKQHPRVRHMRSLWSEQAGFNALEFVVIVVIVCVVVAIGVPMLHARARASVLNANLQTLGSMVKSVVVEGHSPEYRPSGSGDSGDYASLRLEQTLRAAKGKSGYVNPFVTSGQDRTVLNTSALPAELPASPPAILITDSPAYQYASISSLPDQSRLLLTGTLIVGFDRVLQRVNVFYIDQKGQRSSEMVSVPIA
jgi:hypothetical protein